MYTRYSRKFILLFTFLKEILLESCCKSSTNHAHLGTYYDAFSYEKLSPLDRMNTLVDAIDNLLILFTNISRRTYRYTIQVYHWFTTKQIYHDLLLKSLSLSLSISPSLPAWVELELVRGDTKFHFPRTY